MRTKSMSRSLFIEIISVEEILLSSTTKKKKLILPGRVSLNSLTSARHHWGPWKKMIWWASVKKIDTTIILFSKRLRMFYLATKNWRWRIRPKHMFIDSTKRMDRMHRFLSISPSTNGLFPQKMFPFSSRMPTKLNSTRDRDINLLFWLLKLGSDWLQHLIKNKLKPWKKICMAKRWLENIVETPIFSTWLNTLRLKYIFMPLWKTIANIPVSLLLRLSVSFKDTTLTLSRTIREAMLVPLLNFLH